LAPGDSAHESAEASAEEAAAVVREVGAAFERYEQALRRHDVEALNAFFVPTGHSVRYGLAEQHYGIEAIAAWRRSAPPVHPRRRLLRTVISAYGPDVACVSAEFSDPDTDGIGRQTQTWVRTGAGWQIAVAHVSLAPALR
jgi:ketosteroid isomerase-like protein